VLAKKIRACGGQCNHILLFAIPRRPRERVRKSKTKKKKAALARACARARTRVLAKKFAPAAGNNAT
jgi:hypothetical protein